MEGTAFFPQPVEGTSKLVQCLHSGLPVFSRDCGTGGEKTFFACGYVHFVNTMYRKPYMRNVYEVLQWDKPTKLYFDFDKYDDGTTNYGRDQFETLVTRFVAHVLADIKDRWDYAFDPHVTIMDASTDHKMSKHVIFNLYLTDMETVKNYYDFLVGSFSFSDPDEAKIIDDAVYTRNRSFRLLYSSKFGKTNKLRIDGETTEYNPEDVIRSMIQAKCPDHYKGPYRSLTSGQVHFFNAGSGRKRARRRSGACSPGTYVPPSDLPEGVQEYIKSMGGVLRSGRQDDDKFLSFIVGGLHCPWAERVHKSNNTFFTINMDSGMSWCRCADSDCSNMQYLKTNLKWAFN